MVFDRMESHFQPPYLSRVGDSALENATCLVIFIDQVIIKLYRIRDEIVIVAGSQEVDYLL